jgi:trimethylamine corrinoid protein
MKTELAGLQLALLGLDRVGAAEIVRHASASASRLEVVEHLIRPALEHIGERWETGECALSQVYMSGRICEELLATLLPEHTEPETNPATAPDVVGQSGPQSGPRVAIAVLDDYHMLGKQIVRTVLRASGHRVEDYGRVGVDVLVERTVADDIEILLVSTLMLPAALQVAELTKRLRTFSSTTRVVVGGAPYRLDTSLWRDLGADAVGLQAGEVVDIVERLSAAPR